MTSDITDENENERPGSDTELTAFETCIDTEKEPVNENTILTTIKKSRIKIIKNSDCKSWTYHKGNLI